MRGNTILTWNEYQQQALTTAIYPLKRELEYTVFGLLSEVGELAEAQAYSHSTKRRESTKGELGDNFWYVAAIADALNCPLEYVVDYAPVGTPWGFDRREALSAIMVKAGQIAGYVKKSIRDNEGFLTAVAQDSIISRLSQIVSYLEWFAREELSTTVDAVLNDNLNKLADRKQRGVLQGSGDNR